MALLSCYASLCTALAAGSATEMAGVARQPVSFARAVSGSSPSAQAMGFGVIGAPTASGNTAAPLAGIALFSAPSGGALLLTLTPPAPLRLPGNGPLFFDAGDLLLFFTALAGYADSDAATMPLPAATVVGVAKIGPPAFAGPGVLTTGVSLKLTSGVLAAA